MIAESIFNDCVYKLTETAKYFAEKIYNLCVEKGLVDHSLESGFTIDPFDYHVGMDNVIVWGDDYDYVAAKGFDVNEISYDGMNIVLFDENDNSVPFAELPTNSMVFVCNCLEEMYNKEKSK